MKLYSTPASPFVRKILVMAAETGQDVETLKSAVHPVRRNATVVSVNPTGKVPAAVLDDGTALYDSRVICRWLDSRHDGARMYPEPPALWTVLRREALADGLLDAAVLARYETTVRPQAVQWPDWLAAQMDKIGSSVDQMESEADGFAGVDAGLVAIACALSYLDFRFPAYDWRGRCPILSGWFEEFAQRPSMRSTVLHENTGP